MSRPPSRRPRAQRRKPTGFRAFAHECRPGPGLASPLFGMVLGWLVCGPSAGCVVTDKIEFDTEQNVPPMIVDTPSEETPIGRILWVHKATSSMVTFSVKVRDPNVTQALKAHWRLVSKDDPTPQFDSKDVSITGDVVRDLTFELQTSPL